MSTNDYDLYFNPYEHLNDFHKDPKAMRFSLEQLVKFWSKIEKTDIKFLEYGGGATVSKLITACSHVQDIIFAEYLEVCRKAIQAWVDKDPNAFDWKPAFNFIVQELEGKGPDEVAKREEELRHKIRAFVPCDIRAVNILEIPSNLPDKYGPPYDVVATNNCLDVVLANEQEYKQAIKKLAKLVKPGGYLIMHGALNETFLIIGSKKFQSTLQVNKELIVESMKNAGVTDIEIVLESSESSVSDIAKNLSHLTDASEFFFAYGRV